MKINYTQEAQRVAKDVQEALWADRALLDIIDDNHFNLHVVIEEEKFTFKLHGAYGIIQPLTYNILKDIRRTLEIIRWEKEDYEND